MKKRKAGVLMLALLMVLSMLTNVFAASGAVESDRTDFLTDITGNHSAERQANSSNVGTIRLGKILTVNQKGRFPNIEDFVFRITPVAAWNNTDVNGSKGGSPVPQNLMPKPDNSGNAHHSINVVQSDSGDASPWSALVAIGNFKDGSESNTSSIYGDRDHNYINSDDASNIEMIDEGRRRTRVTDVSFNFSVSGYYMYKIEEAGSSRNGDISAANLRKDAAGVDYDDNTYYVVFYVCNRQATEDVEVNEYGHGTREGDTAEGVYVHTITSWTNDSETDYRPDNTMRTSDEPADAQNWLNDLMESEDVDSRYDTEYGDGGHAAEPNTGRAGASGSNGSSSAVHDNLGKVGISTPENPNYLEAYRMWNGQVTHDVVLKKKVTGNLGDLSKEFIFEVSLTGLEANQTYTTDLPAGSDEDDGNATGDSTTAGVRLYDMTPASCLAADGKSFTADDTGTVTFKVNLKDEDILVLNSLPMSSSYQVTELASDHVAQYNIVSTNKYDPSVSPVRGITAKGPALFTETGHTAGGTSAEFRGKANTDANTPLSTEVEFVDRYDGTVTIVYRNNRDLATLTGIAGLDYMVYAAALAVLSALAFVIVRRRREYAEEDRLSA